MKSQNRQNTRKFNLKSAWGRESKNMQTKK